MIYLFPTFRCLNWGIMAIAGQFPNPRRNLSRDIFLFRGGADFFSLAHLAVRSDARTLGIRVYEKNKNKNKRNKKKIELAPGLGYDVFLGVHLGDQTSLQTFARFGTDL